MVVFWKAGHEGLVVTEAPRDLVNDLQLRALFGTIPAAESRNAADRVKLEDKRVSYFANGKEVVLATLEKDKRWHSSLSSSVYRTHCSHMKTLFDLFFS